MTAPDRIQITHQDPMTTPTIRAALDIFQQAANRGTAVYLSPELVQELRAALKAEPEGEGPRPLGDWFTVAMIAQDMRSRGLAEQVVGEELLKLAYSNRSQPGRPAIQPAPEREEGPTLADVDELCAKFGFHYDDDQGESLEMLRDMILASLTRWGPPSAAAPEPGENLATPSAPEPGEVEELVGWLNQVAQYLVDNGVTGAPHVQGAAILLEQQEAELAALRQQPHPTFQDAIRLAEGCHDYSGGYSGAEGEAWHGAIDTVVAVLKKATDEPWDSQTMAVFGVGVEAQAGEVAVPVAVSERLRVVKAGIRAGYNLGHHHTVEGGWGDPDEVADDIAQETLDDLPAPQAGEVEA